MAAHIQSNASLQDLNTLAVPARAERFVQLLQPEDLADLLTLAQRSNWTVRILGEGSNVLLGEWIDGLLIQQCCGGIEIVEETAQAVTVAVAGGEIWHELVEWCLQRGLFGLENLALIPGTVGAAPIQNIGAYGVEVGRFVESVQCRDLRTGASLQLTQQECEFAYRDSVFKQRLRDTVIVEQVRFRLPRQAQVESSYPSLATWLQQRNITQPRPQQIFDAVVAIRTARLPDPYEIPNAGSFFKNPRVSATQLARLLEAHPQLPHYRETDGDHYKLAAAWLIEYCGFKQRTDGPVEVHPDHALVIINPQRRPAVEIAQFAAEIVADVEREFGLRLEQEPRSYG